MDISTKSVDELKVIAYDLIVTLERIQANLRIVNQELEKRTTKVEPPKEQP